MGYILPVNHDQYKQYAIRASKRKEFPFSVDPVEKVHFHKVKAKKEWDELNRPDFVRNTYRRKVVDQKIIDQHYSKLTGKGKYINEVV
jgi:hypothetical protein